MTITFNIISEFIAFITSVALWNTLKKGKLCSLPFFLFFILLVEITGNYLRHQHRPNVGLYNISIPIEYVYYAILFYLHGSRILKLFTQFSILCIAIISIYSFIQLPNTFFHSYVLVTGQSGIIISCCIFLYEQFQKTEDESSLLKKYFFWLSAGLLLFNLGELTYFLLFPIINKHQWDKFDFIFKATNNSLLVLLYLSYIISMVVFKKYNSTNAK